MSRVTLEIDICIGVSEIRNIMRAASIRFGDELMDLHHYEQGIKVGAKE